MIYPGPAPGKNILLVLHDDEPELNPQEILDHLVKKFPDVMFGFVTGIRGLQVSGSGYQTFSDLPEVDALIQRRKESR